MKHLKKQKKQKNQKKKRNNIENPCDTPKITPEALSTYLRLYLKHNNYKELSTRLHSVKLSPKSKINDSELILFLELKWVTIPYFMDRQLIVPIKYFINTGPISFLHRIEIPYVKKFVITLQRHTGITLIPNIIDMPYSSLTGLESIIQKHKDIGLPLGYPSICYNWRQNRYATINYAKNNIDINTGHFDLDAIYKNDKNTPYANALHEVLTTDKIRLPLQYSIGIPCILEKNLPVTFTEYLPVKFSSKGISFPYWGEKWKKGG